MASIADYINVLIYSILVLNVSVFQLCCFFLGRELHNIMIHTKIGD